MVGCCAYGCSNSKRANPDLIFHKFPADTKQKMEWVVKVCRADDNGNLWLPNQHRLCSAHFAKECYTTRMSDKKQILKPGAIPTIFAHLKGQNLPTTMFPKSGKPAQQDESQFKSSDTEQPIMESDHTYSTEHCELGERRKFVDKSTQISTGYEELKACKRQLELMKRLYKKERKLNQNLSSSLERLFTEDQMEALKRVSPQGLLWGQETIRKAIHIRFACGRAGYKMLLQRGYPLPCVRTLQRRLESTPSVVPTLFDGPKAPENVLPNEVRTALGEIKDSGDESEGDVIDHADAVASPTGDETSKISKEGCVEEDIGSELQPEIVMYLPESAKCDITPT